MLENNTSSSEKRIGWFLRYSKVISMALYAWIILGTIATVALFIIFWPPGPALGWPWSPYRILMADSFAVFVLLPMGLLVCKWYAENQKWLAEDNGDEYEEGKNYPVWTTRRIVGIAIGAAFFGATSFVQIPGVDLAIIAASFIAILLGPISALLSLTLGWILIRFPLVMGVWDPTWWPIGALLDGGIWAINAYIYHRFIRGKELKNKVPYYAVYIAIAIILHALVFIGWLLTALNPAPAVYLEYVNWLLNIPMQIVWVTVALVASDAAWRYIYR
jgi:hypothetical protein